LQFLLFGEKDQLIASRAWRPVAPGQATEQTQGCPNPKGRAEARRPMGTQRQHVRRPIGVAKNLSMLSSDDCIIADHFTELFDPSLKAPC
jgi:hypothetical protein